MKKQKPSLVNDVLVGAIVLIVLVAFLYTVLSSTMLIVMVGVIFGLLGFFFPLQKY